MYIHEKNPSCPYLDLRIKGGTAMYIGGVVRAESGRIFVAVGVLIKNFVASRPRNAPPSIKSRPATAHN